MKNYIPSLNGLRAISILLVILGHAKSKTFEIADVPFLFKFFFDGSLGVNVFFIISGFLITTLLIIENNETGTISLKQFYIRRIFRIFPAYYFVLLVYFILQTCGVLYFTKGSWLSSIFYYKYFGEGEWESGHFWSLSVEEHFYLVWPALFIIFRNQKKILTGFAVAVILAVMAFRFNAYYKFWPNPYALSTVSIFLRGDAIMIGCLLAMHKERVVTLVNRSKYFFGNLLVLLLLLLLFSYELIPTLNIKYNLHLGFLIVPFGIGESFGFLSNCIVALIITISITRRGKWFDFLNLPVMNYIGKLSYSLYLWQQMFFSPRLGWLSRLPYNLIAIIATANLSYYFIEKPFLRLKDTYHKKKMSLSN